MSSFEGPYIVWENLGYDGWVPNSFNTLEEAIKANKYSSEFVITKIVKFEIIETNKDA